MPERNPEQGPHSLWQGYLTISTSLKALQMIPIGHQVGVPRPAASAAPVNLLECTFSDPTPAILDQKLWEWSSAFLEGDSKVCQGRLGGSR